MTASGGDPAVRSTGLDAARALAALLVVLTHASRPGMFPELPFGPWGGNGVALFFALSGYLIWKPFVNGRPGLRSYLLRRSARILPGWWLAAIGVSVLVGGQIFPTLFMQQTPPTYLGVAWTLRAEVMFYAVVPVLALFGRPLLVPIAFGVLSLVADVVLPNIRGTPAEAFILVRFWSFALGMILAASAFRPGLWAAGVGVGLMAIGAGTNHAWGGQWVNLATYGGAFFVVAWSIRARFPLAALWGGLAAISYGLYLWHADLIDAFGLPGLWMAVAVAAASYLLLERPVLRWAHRRSGTPIAIRSAMKWTGPQGSAAGVPGVGP